MTITFELPRDIENQLRADGTDLARDVKEVYLVEQYRRGHLSLLDLGNALGLDRFEVTAFLKRRDIFDGTLTHEEVDADLASARALVGPHHP